MPYEVGQRVIVHIPTTRAVPDPIRTKATGTVVNKPGGVVYDVELDQPQIEADGTTYNILTYLSEADLEPFE